jgi:hypothetical protein
MVKVEFDGCATVADAIGRALKELGGAVNGCQMVGDDSMPLDRSRRLSELDEPRDLWVEELIVFEIRSRLDGVSKRCDIVA